MSAPQLALTSIAIAVMGGTAHCPEAAGNVDSFLGKGLTTMSKGATYIPTPPLCGVRNCAMRRFTTSKPAPVIANTTATARFNARMFKITGAMFSC